jgi:O-antigen/teichoic acid export membrane protein
MNSKLNLFLRRRLVSNVVWNFMGIAIPLFVAFLMIPRLIDILGNDRFGLLSIIWAGVGYFSLFDFGFGRALSKLVAERLAKQYTQDLGELIWTCLVIVITLGIVASIVITYSAHYLIYQVLNVPIQLKGEALLAIQVLAIGVPFVIISSALIGLIEACNGFRKIALVRIPLGLITFLGPFIAAKITPHLAVATGVLVFARLIAMAIYFLTCRGFYPVLRELHMPRRLYLQELLAFGGWLTVSNMIGPIIVYFDRFIIGAMFSLAEVAYYVTPYELLSRLSVVPQALVGALFPTLTTTYVSDKARFLFLAEKATRFLFIVLVFPLTLLFMFVHEGLAFWLNEEFSLHATPIAQWMIVGIMINFMARIPYTVLQSAGRPDLIAKLHLIEVGPYIVILFLLTQAFGLVGASMAWMLRSIVDSIALFCLAGKVVPSLRTLARQVISIYMPIILLLFFICLSFNEIIHRVFISALIFLVVIILAWSEVSFYNNRYGTQSESYSNSD